MVGVVPVVITHMLLHDRRLGGILESLCKLTLVWQIADHLVVDIIAELSCAEIDIACIGKRTVNILVIGERIPVDWVNLIAIDNLLAGTAQLYAIESVRFE